MNACPTPVYAAEETPAPSIACTWNSSLIRSSGADAVRAMMPAAPPAAAWREPMAMAYMRFITPPDPPSSAEKAVG